MTAETYRQPSSNDDQDLSTRVFKLRALVASGKYRVPAEKIAEAMLKEHRLS